MPLVIRGRRGCSRVRGPPILPRSQRGVDEEPWGFFGLGGKIMRSQTNFLERTVLVLVGIFAVVGLTAGAATPKGLP